MQKIGMKRLLVNELLNKVCKYLWGDKSQDGQVYLWTQKYYLFPIQDSW